MGLDLPSISRHLFDAISRPPALIGKPPLIEDADLRFTLARRVGGPQSQERIRFAFAYRSRDGVLAAWELEPVATQAEAWGTESVMRGMLDEISTVEPDRFEADDDRFTYTLDIAAGPDTDLG
ncbi:hypothetical protein [Salininema proteolyticum]|uniref:Uncharacterized protein n=1 Tax=Salininema proteolyticum TaxID=1607685 RepID=A0ABV8U3C6_9ACTN